jgi:hypothetical protein
MYNKLVEQNLIHKNWRVLNFMWTLVFLKVYLSENALCTLLKCSGKTLRKWVWYYLEKCSQIELVRTENYIVILTLLYYSGHRYSCKLCQFQLLTHVSTKILHKRCTYYMFLKSPCNYLSFYL